jgi:hypothetical protein
MCICCLQVIASLAAVAGLCTLEPAAPSFGAGAQECTRPTMAQTAKLMREVEDISQLLKVGGLKRQADTGIAAIEPRRGGVKGEKPKSKIQLETF